MNRGRAWKAEPQDSHRDLQRPPLIDVEPPGIAFPQVELHGPAIGLEAEPAPSLGEAKPTGAEAVKGGGGGQ